MDLGELKISIFIESLTDESDCNVTAKIDDSAKLSLIKIVSFEELVKVKIFEGRNSIEVVSTLLKIYFSVDITGLLNVSTAVTSI